MALVLIAAFLGYRAFDRVASTIRGEDVNAMRAAESSGVVPASARSGGGAPGTRAPGAGLSLDDFKPRLNGRPESAPLYDGIRQVVAMPAVAGCMATPRRCTCYTEQGSESGLSDAECRAWLKSPPFNPFRPVYPPAVEKGGDGRPGPVQPSPDAS